MSVHFNCKCDERKKPIEERDWVLLKYKHNNSSFNGYRETISDYSTIECLKCGAIGRTKAAYCDKLRYK